jgi:acetyltransferase-like isoleucine patch superfamily enzyme
MLYRGGWFLRHLAYKALFKKLAGIGYFGKPIFCKGLKGVSIDRNFRLFPGSRIECLNSGTIVVGKNVSIGQNLFIQTSSEIKIGDNVVMSANVFIGTTDYIIEPYIADSFLSQHEKERSIMIEGGAFIGYGAVILPGSYLSKGCVVGANSVVKGKFESDTIIAGIPAKVIGKR